MWIWSVKLALILCVIALVKSQSNHIIELYDSNSGFGSSVLIDGYVENLSEIGFNDVTTSLCIVQGIWLLYENANFNINAPGASGFNWGINFCQDLPPLLNNRVTSVRYAGSAWGFQEDGLIIYENDWFQSREMYAAADFPSLGRFSYGGSLIVTGQSAWTLYEYPYYTGYRVCVTPLDIVDASPGFYTEPYDFGFAGRVIRSVRKGCWGDRSIYTAIKIEPGKLYSSYGAGHSDSIVNS